MTLTTDDLRQALADAAESRRPVGLDSRVAGVRARVRRSRRRRTAAFAAVAGASASAVVVAGVLAGGDSRPAPLPATPPTVGSVSMPSLWGVRDVVGDVTGSGWQVPRARLRWPSRTTGLLVHCTGTDRAVQVDLRPAIGAASRTSIPCQGTDGAWHAADLPAAASSIGAGTEVTVRAQLDAPEAGTSFGVALLVGEDLIDGSLLATPPPGYARFASFALSDGFFYRWTGDDIDPSAVAAGAAPDSADLLGEGGSDVRLRIRCSGRSWVEVTGGDGQALGSVECPAGERVTREIDLAVPPSDGRLTVRLADAAPGALVQVGAYTR